MYFFSFLSALGLEPGTVDNASRTLYHLNWPGSLEWGNVITCYIFNTYRICSQRDQHHKKKRKKQKRWNLDHMIL